MLERLFGEGWTFEPDRPRRNGEKALLVLLFFLAFGTRWPLRGISLEEQDSGSYALGVLDFDIAQHQPHPPGYVLFIWAGKLAYRFTGDPVAALTAVNAVSGSLATPLYYAVMRGGLAPLPSLLATLMTAFTGNVWFQQVRPLEDGFGFLWMLAAAYPLVRSLRSDPRWWISGMFVLGLSGGAKQAFALFLSGLFAHTFLAQVARRRAGVIGLGILAALAGIAVWLIPMALNAGSLRGYLEMVVTQARFQRVETLLYNPHRLAEWTAWSLVDIWRSPGLALPLWCLAGLGSLGILAFRREAAWLLTLSVPTLLSRFLFLGAHPRYSTYYAPLVIALAMLGVEIIALAATALRSRAPRKLRALSRREALGVSAGAVLFAGLFMKSEIGAILPTLYVLHSQPAPVVRALAFVRAHFDPQSTLLLSHQAVLNRQLEYYTRLSPFPFADLALVGPGDLEGKKNVLKLQVGRIPFLGEFRTEDVVPRGRFKLEVPGWRFVAHQDLIWDVRVFELRGHKVLLHGWQRLTEAGSTVWRAGPAGARILVFSPPPRDFRVRLRGRLAPPGGEGGCVLWARVNRRRRFEWSGPTSPTSTTSEYLVPVRRDQAAEDSVVLSVRPRCFVSPGVECEPVEGSPGCEFLLEGVDVV